MCVCAGESIDCVEVTEGDIRKVRVCASVWGLWHSLQAFCLRVYMCECVQVSLHYGPICAVERIAPHCYVSGVHLCVCVCVSVYLCVCVCVCVVVQLSVYETERAASCANDGFNERIEVRRGHNTLAHSTPTHIHALFLSLFLAAMAALSASD